MCPHPDLALGNGLNKKKQDAYAVVRYNILCRYIHARIWRWGKALWGADKKPITAPAIYDIHTGDKGLEREKQDANVTSKLRHTRDDLAEIVAGLGFR